MNILAQFFFFYLSRFSFVLVVYQREIFNEVPTEVATKQNLKVGKITCIGEMIRSKVSEHSPYIYQVLSVLHRLSLLLYAEESLLKLSNLFTAHKKERKIRGYF